MAHRLKNKVALITGAGSGIGEACMSLFADEGATVIGCGRRVEPLNKVLAAVQGNGGKGQVYRADLANDDEAQELVERVITDFGAIDVLVHSAGVGLNWGAVSENSMNDIAQTPPEKWQEVMQINLAACFSMCRAVLPKMLENGRGSIINISSIGGLQGTTSAHTYAAAKAGMINLSQSMAVTYGGRGVRTNCVCPGLTDTPMVDGLTAAMGENEDFLKSVSPMGRLGLASEIAYGCLFLASDESSYCNGVVLPIDGGATAGSV